jgi:hypothetical protein
MTEIRLVAISDDDLEALASNVPSTRAQAIDRLADRYSQDAITKEEVERIYPLPGYDTHNEARDSLRAAFDPGGRDD